MKRALALLFVLTGCTTTANFAPSQAQRAFAPRTAPDQIEMFRSQVPSRKYVEIGSVNVCCLTETSSIEKLKEKAAEVGGDAIVAIDFDATGVATAAVIRYQ